MFDRNNFDFFFCLIALTYENKVCSGLYISAGVSGFASLKWNLNKNEVVLHT